MLVDCCLQEKIFNPYYSYLAQKLCEFKKANQASKISPSTKETITVVYYIVYFLSILSQYTILHHLLGYISVCSMGQVQSTGLLNCHQPHKPPQTLYPPDHKESSLSIHSKGDYPSWSNASLSAIIGLNVTKHETLNFFLSKPTLSINKQTMPSILCAHSPFQLPGFPIRWLIPQDSKYLQA